MNPQALIPLEFVRLFLPTHGTDHEIEWQEFEGQETLIYFCKTCCWCDPSRIQESLYHFIQHTHLLHLMEYLCMYAYHATVQSQIHPSDHICSPLREDIQICTLCGWINPESTCPYCRMTLHEHFEYALDKFQNIETIADFAYLIVV